MTVVLTTYLPEGDHVFFLLVKLLFLVSFAIGWADEDDAEYFILSTCLLIAGVSGIQFLGDSDSILTVTRMASSMVICGAIALLSSVGGDLLRGWYLTRQEQKTKNKNSEE